MSVLANSPEVNHNRKATRKATTSPDGLTRRDKRNRKRYLCDFIQKHRALTPADKAVGRLLVNWYNETDGFCYASIEALANELELSRRTLIRAVGKLHRLGIVRRNIGGGWDHGKMRHNTSKYFPAFELVTHKDTGRPRKNLPPSLSTSPVEAPVSNEVGCHSDTVSNCHPTNPPETAEIRESRVPNCHPDTDNESSGGANAPAAPAPNGSGSGSLASASEMVENGAADFEGIVSEIADGLGISSKDFLAYLDGEDETGIVRELLASKMARHFSFVMLNKGDEASCWFEAFKDAAEEHDTEADAELRLTVSGLVCDRMGSLLKPSSWVTLRYPYRD